MKWRTTFFFQREGLFDLRFHLRDSPFFATISREGDQKTISGLWLVAAETAYGHVLASASRWLYPTVLLLPLPNTILLTIPYEVDKRASFDLLCLFLAFSSRSARTDKTLSCLHLLELLNMTTECVPGLLVYHKDYSLGRPSRPMLPNWLVWATRHIQTSAEINAASGAMLSRCYSKTTSSVRLLPSWASFPASSCRLPLPFLCILPSCEPLSAKVYLLHFFCCAPSCRCCYSYSLTAYCHTSNNIVLKRNLTNLFKIKYLKCPIKGNAR